MSIPDSIDPKDLCAADAWFWAYWNKIKLKKGVFSLEGHEYLVKPMQSQVKKRADKKGAQMGFSEKDILRAIHGMIFGHYPLGVFYVFPTDDDVSEFSKDRFKPLFLNNFHQIGRFIRDTDAINIKHVGAGTLYLHGARATQKIGDLIKESSKTRSRSADRIVLDEVDLMDPDMVQNVLVRYSASEVQEEGYLSTPTMPDFGIDKLYNESDQEIWVIKCPACNRDCCLELDFISTGGACVKFHQDGKAYRACIKCGAELDPSKGQWIAQYPSRSKDFEGTWIGQLNLKTVDPGKILYEFENPPNGNPQTVYNSRLAMAYIAAENRLTVNDVYTNCGTHIIQAKDHGPCGMGIDVQGPDLKIVIGKKVKSAKTKIIWIGSVPDFNDAVELGKRFNVRQAAVDMYPETRKAKDFQKNGVFPVLLCYYVDKMKTGEKMDDLIGTVGLARTEILDQTGFRTKNGFYIFPRRCPQVEEFALQMSNTAKILETDERRGTKFYRYKRLGPDHFRHAMNYLEIAIKPLPESVEDPLKDMLRRFASEGKDESYDVLRFGLDKPTLLM